MVTTCFEIKIQMSHSNNYIHLTETYLSFPFILATTIHIFSRFHKQCNAIFMSSHLSRLIAVECHQTLDAKQCNIIHTPSQKIKPQRRLGLK